MLTRILSRVVKLITAIPYAFKLCLYDRFLLSGNSTASGSILNEVSGISLLQTGEVSASRLSLNNSANSFYNPSSSIAYISAPGDGAFDLDTGDFTVEFWALYSFGLAIGIPTLSTHALSLSYNTGVRLLMENAASVAMIDYAGSDLVMSDNKFHHFAVTRQAGLVKLFLDGSIIYQGTALEAGPGGCDFVASGTINTSGPAFAYTTKAIMSNVRFIKGTAIYTSPFTPPTSHLTAIPGTQALMLHDALGKDGSEFNRLTVNSMEPTLIAPFNEPLTGYSIYTNRGQLQMQENFSFGSGDFEVSCYFYRLGNGEATDNTTGNVLVYAGSGPANNVILLSVDNFNSVYGRIGSNATSYVVNLKATTAAKPGWNYVQLKRTSGTVQLILNNVIKGTAANATDLSAYSPTVTIGNQLGASRGFNGYIADAKITIAGTLKLQTTLTDSLFTDPTGKSVLYPVGSVAMVIDNKKFGSGAVRFTGGTDAIKVICQPAVELGVNDFTFDGWINCTDASVTQRIFWQASATASNYSSLGISVANSKLAICIAYSSSAWLINAVDIGNIVSGQWHHIAVTRLGGNVFIHIDGIKVYTSAISTSQAVRNGLHFLIGNSTEVTPAPFIGYMDDIRFAARYARYTADNFEVPSKSLQEYNQ